MCLWVHLGSHWYSLGLSEAHFDSLPTCLEIQYYYILTSSHPMNDSPLLKKRRQTSYPKMTSPRLLLRCPYLVQ